MKRWQVCVTIYEDIVEGLKKLSKETGLSISAIVNMRMRGYKIAPEQINQKILNA